MRTVHEVDDAGAGARVDERFRVAAGLSRQQARTLCTIGAVACNGVVATPQQRLAAGDRLAWHGDLLEPTLQLGLCVHWCDDDVCVVQKPAGLAVHAGPLVDDSVAARLSIWPGAGLAQRLDREASGLLLIGRHAEALRTLAEAMERGAIERSYLAVTNGSIAADRQTIDLPLRSTDEPRGDRPKVIVDREQGRPARSHVTVLARAADRTLVEVALETGRTHQIRAHLAAIGHPLLGDPRYGDATTNERARATHGVHRTLLHGQRLTFPHPQDGSTVAVTAFAAPDLVRLFAVAAAD